MCRRETSKKPQDDDARPKFPGCERIALGEGAEVPLQQDSELLDLIGCCRRFQEAEQAADGGQGHLKGWRRFLRGTVVRPVAG